MTHPDHSPLADYSPGQRIHSLVLLVRSVSLRTLATGGNFAAIQVSDSSDTRCAKYWNVSEAQLKSLSKARFIQIKGRVDDKEKYVGEITIEDYEIVPEPSDLSRFLSKPPSNHRDTQQRFKKIVASIKDPELYRVLKLVFEDVEFRSRFNTGHAAKSVHHAFSGGLLEHSVEVAELCSSCCEILTKLDRHLLVTAALLHDIGKLQEMEHGLYAGSYTAEGVLIGHLVLGSVHVAQAIDRHNDTAPDDEISLETKRALMHLILSHHGLPEHGSARTPAFAEAAVLNLCDNISAKAYQFLEEVDNNVGSDISRKNAFLGGTVYLKPPRESPWNSEDGASSTTLPSFLDDEEKHKTFITASVLPVLGLVAAGAPDEKRDESLDSLNHRRCVPPPNGADYLLEVTGDSMIGAGINEGDLLFVKRQETAREGEIVVAHLGGEGQTVKYLRSNPKGEHGMDGPFLEAANPKYTPIPITSETRIQGRVTGLLRDL